MRQAVRATVVVLVSGVGTLAAGCGQKGPPLAPLHLVPAAVTEVSARRVGDRVELRFVLPAKNANGPGPLELDHVEIFAITVGPGAPVPANRTLMTKTYQVGEIQVRPAAVEGEQPPAAPDTRPEPGTAVTFVDELTAAKLTPSITAPPTPAAPAAAPAAAVPPVAAPAAGAPDPAAAPAAATATAATATAVTPPAHPQRIYVMRGVTPRGRSGPPSTRVALPLIDLPPAPAEMAVRFTENAIVLEWKPPAGVAGYNVYRSAEPMRPVNPAPLTVTTFETSDIKVGEPHCFRIRSVTTAGAASVEGDLSKEQCVTPQDTFPPAAPKGLAAVPTPGQITLIWDPNTEKDLAGYIVLRGVAPDGPLEPVTPAPIRETSYRDATVKPGTLYIYAVVAVDAATPPNASPQSPRVEETAR